MAARSVRIEERRRRADENVVAAFAMTQEHLADPRGGRARFGAVDVVAVGVDVAFFNPVLALDPATTSTDVRAAIAWVESKGLPVSVQVREDVGPEVGAAVEELGMVADSWRTPVMVLDPIPSGSGGFPSPLPEVAIRSGGLELLEDWHTAIESGETFRTLFGASIAGDPGVRLAVGYLDAEPVSGAAAIRSGSTLGIYAVGTRARARRLGIGRAATWAAIESGRAAWASKIAILQSSELGLPVYTSMGFEIVSHYVEFDRPTT